MAAAGYLGKQIFGSARSATKNVPSKRPWLGGIPEACGLSQNFTFPRHRALCHQNGEGNEQTLQEMENVPVSGAEERMEPDDLLCSRNTRLHKVWRKGVRSFLCSRRARPQKDGEGAARCPSCSQNAHARKVLVRCAQ